MTGQDFGIVGVGSTVLDDRRWQMFADYLTRPALPALSCRAAGYDTVTTYDEQADHPWVLYIRERPERVPA